MKLVVKTKFGTTFVLNSRNVTWVRDSGNHPDTIFGNEGRLTKWPDVKIGEPLTLDVIGKGDSMFTAGHITSGPVTAVFEVGPHDEEMYGIRIPKTKAEQKEIEERNNEKAKEHRQTTMFKTDNLVQDGIRKVCDFFNHADKMKGAFKSSAPIKVKPMTQADGYAGEDLTFGDGKLRYTDDKKTTFKTVSKDEPKRETVTATTFDGEKIEVPVENWGGGIKAVRTCTRNEGHNGPCNGMPRIESEGMCYNSKPNLLIAHLDLHDKMTLHLVKGTMVTRIPVYGKDFFTQATAAYEHAKVLEARVYTECSVLRDFLEQRGIEVKFMTPAFVPAGWTEVR